jgi:UDP-N-acetylmuramoyl-tripeptide--D-alanyl-D-alanine ligase
MKRLKELYKVFLKYPKISTDTRKEIENTIFFALSGDNFNGNAYAKPALERGARLVVIDDEAYYCGENCLLVNNVLTTLQGLALLHRKKHPIPIVGITGSNGKTTTKELISSVLGSSKNSIATVGNFNNHIGVPLTLLRITNQTELAIVEMGANHIGEIAALCKIAQPNIGIITNIGKAHLEGFGNFEGVIKAKNELYQYLDENNGLAIVNANDALLMDLSKNLQRFTYGNRRADMKGRLTKTNPTLELEWAYAKTSYPLKTQLYGRYNFQNIMAAVATGIYFHIRPEMINVAIANFVPGSNRSQKIETAENSIMLDAYNANPVSMTEAIKSFNDYAPQNPWLILGDMFELGKSADEEHRHIVELIGKLGFEQVILVGKDFYKLKGLTKYICCQTTGDASQYLTDNKITDANILVKGSRGMQLETLLKQL